MRRATLLASAALAAALTACPNRPARPPAPPVTDAPLPQKTFGDIRFAAASTQLISYKDIRLLVDPAAAVEPLPPLDYLLLTDNQALHFAPGARDRLRRDLKMLAPASAAQALRAAGFTQVKSLAAGQRLLLRKHGAFLFVTAVGGSEGALAPQGYLLEFDNGRNVFIAGDRGNPDSLREFVYTLRDDGKEVHVLVLYSGVPGASEAALAEMIGLIQPQLALVTPSHPAAALPDPAALRKALAGQMYAGALRFPSAAEPVVF